MIVCPKCLNANNRSTVETISCRSSFENDDMLIYTYKCSEGHVFFNKVKNYD